jgi:DNA polymerase (family 10)
VVAELSRVCSRVEVAGSIRRQRPEVKDIDLVVPPTSIGALDSKLRELDCDFGGPKLRRLVYKGARVDIYIAGADTWAMLLLVRTGSTAHNKQLAIRAKRLGLHFAADGRGILQDNKPIAYRSEEEIFAALGLPFKPPEERA